jgi:tRNA-2-methylthio-N6-dimethylallyladenosine synthase
LGEVVREVTDLVATGITEVTLLGQTVNSYHDGAHDFGDLLRAVGAVSGLRRLRFTSPYPTDFTPRVIEAMADTPAVCEHAPWCRAARRRAPADAPALHAGAYLDADHCGAMPAPISTDIIVVVSGTEDFADTLSLADARPDEHTFLFRTRQHLHGQDPAMPEPAPSGRARSPSSHRRRTRAGHTHEVLSSVARRGMLAHA